MLQSCQPLHAACCGQAGLGLERAHMGIFTELGVLYSKYKEEKLMEHVKHSVLLSSVQAQLWQAAHVRVQGRSIHKLAV